MNAVYCIRLTRPVSNYLCALRSFPVEAAKVKLGDDKFHLNFNGVA